MKFIRQTKFKWVLGAVAASVAALAFAADNASIKALTDKIVKESFRDEGIVKASVVLNADETARACSEADASGKPLSAKAAKFPTARLARASTTTAKAVA